MTSRWDAILPLAAAIALGLATLALLWLLARPLAILFLAITVAEALSPVVRRLQAKMPRVVAILLVYAGFVAIVLVIGWLIVPTLVAQARQLIRAAPDLLSSTRQWLGKWDQKTGGELSNTVASGLQAVGTSFMSLPISIATATFSAFVVVFLSIYWLIGQAQLHVFTISLFPADRQVNVTRVLAAIGAAIGGYVRGVAIDAVIMGVIAGVGCWPASSSRWCSVWSRWSANWSRTSARSSPASSPSASDCCSRHRKP